MNYKDLKIGKLQIKIQFSGSSWQSLDVATGLPSPGYPPPELNHCCPLGGGNVLCWNLHPAHFRAFHGQPKWLIGHTYLAPGDPCAKPMNSKSRDSHLVLLRPRSLPSTCELPLSSLSSLQGKLCSWIHFRNS